MTTTTRRTFLGMLAAAAALLRLRPRSVKPSAPPPTPAPKATLWIGHF
jgi:hypothetical protein